MKKIARFFRKHLKSVLIVVVAIALIVGFFCLIKYVNKFGNNAANSTVVGNSNGESGVVAIDGYKVDVFDSEDEARANPVTTDVGIRSFTVNGKKPKVKIDNGSVNELSDGKYELHLENLPNESTAMITVKTGGDGSFISDRLGKDVETRYLMLTVNNPISVIPEGETSSTGSANTSGVPTGKVSFAGSTFQTYGTEADAQAVVANKRDSFTIPTSMAKELTLTAEPSEGTARMLVYLCMVDEAAERSLEKRLNQDNNWTNSFDVSAYAGHQVTFCIKSEDSMGLSNGYSYVSFFVPEFEAPAGKEIIPVVGGEN